MTGDLTISARTLKVLLDAKDERDALRAELKAWTTWCCGDYFSPCIRCARTRTLLAGGHD